MVHVDLVRHLALTLEALSRAVSVKDAFKPTHSKLNTYLDKSMLVVSIMVKIQAKEVMD